MRVLKVSLRSPDPTVVQAAARAIREGGIVLYPTDTIYGLGCDPFQSEAVRRIVDLKGRPEEKGLLLLVPGLDWVKRVSKEIPRSFEPLAEKLWPGPVTLLFRGASELSPLILGDEGKVGLRCPGVKFLDEWMQALPGPIISTSANRSGEPSPRTLAALKELFSAEVDLFIEAGEPASTQPSTVVDLTTDPPRIVREGRETERVREVLAGLV